MSESKLTPWFDSDAKPVRPGVYERAITNLSFYSRWNGRHWCVGRFDVYSASRQRTRSTSQTAPWRGLTEAEYLRRRFRQTQAAICTAFDEGRHFHE